MSFLSTIFRLCNRLAGITPDPDLDLLEADRITTDFYPYEGGDDYLVRMYAEKQIHSGRMKIKFQFQHVTGDALKSAMMDSAVNDFTPAGHSNLTLREALTVLTGFTATHDVRRSSTMPARPMDDEVSVDQALEIYAKHQAQYNADEAPTPKP